MGPMHTWKIDARIASIADSPNANAQFIFQSPDMEQAMRDVRHICNGEKIEFVNITRMVEP